MSLPLPIIAVFAGGSSAERDVSLGSGKASALALARSYPTRLFELNTDALPAGLDPQRHVVFRPYTEPLARMAGCNSSSTRRV